MYASRKSRLKGLAGADRRAGCFPGLQRPGLIEAMPNRISLPFWATEFSGAPTPRKIHDLYEDGLYSFLY